MLTNKDECARIEILGVNFDCVDLSGAISIIEKYMKSGEPHYIVTPNLHFIALAERDDEFRAAIKGAHLSLADGVPLIWLSRIAKLGLKNKVSGSDLTPALCKHLSKTPWSIFFLGTSDMICHKTSAKLKSMYPGLKIAGHYSPPYGDIDEEEQKRIREQINKVHPEVVLVALGNPKQELWMAKNYRLLNVPVLIGIGCSLDFIAGTVKRAPVFMQKCGLEWLFRILMEPRRLAPRYFSDVLTLVKITLKKAR